MISMRAFEVDMADTGGERDANRLVRQGDDDGRAGRPMRSDHPAYGRAYWEASRTRLVLDRQRVLCVLPAWRHLGGARTLGMFATHGADADEFSASFVTAGELAALVRDGARIIDLEGNDVTLYATPLQ